MDDNSFDNEIQHFAVSFQVLILLKWLFEYEPEAIKKIISRSLKNGLDEVLFMPAERVASDEDLQYCIVEFFSLLEALLYEIVHEDEAKKLKGRVLIPAIDRIDGAACDHALVDISIAKAASAVKSNPYEDPKEALCRELLKRWKPTKNEALH